MTDAPELVSKKVETSTLTQEHPEDEKTQDICKQYAFIRRIKGDGNCFYRALIFGHLESLLQNVRDMQNFKDKLMQTSKDLLTAGFNESSFKDILNTFVSVVERCEADDQGTTLLELFNEQHASNSTVQYLRLLTSAYLQNHSDFFQHFVEAPSLKEYCTQEVEAMAMECDHVEITALSEALGISIHIVSMEEGDGRLTHHTIPEGANPSLHLLYKTSHYDILYPNIHL
ncbi:ubiquitin thioesterase OTUB2-like [Megalops cyprinoides]|uniref:ubiquitin thioesterase OTUB2-like n=1 Tax=Megalops cyprinoides TaxID=118141 RepID=UPI001863AE2E|nr:ubiquitin thioesterase OTUB2-like [Megalops cyprinoides]